MYRAKPCGLGAGFVQAARRKELGAYYTPPDLADVLADWAVTGPNLRVLEPSIGQGALVKALLRRFSADAAGTIVGCEIDPRTIKKVIQSLPDRGNDFRNVDFLSQSPIELGDFDAVVANPPFTRNHELSRIRRKALRARTAFKNIVAGAPGLWVYFLLHSLQFLKDGGRLAFVVPGAIEFADYARPVVEELLKRFGQVRFVRVTETIDWEGDAQQHAVLVLAADYGHGPAERLERGEIARDRTCLLDVAAPVDKFAVEGAATLGDLAMIEIGVVTGANDVFLLNQETVRTNKIPAGAVAPIVSRARHAKGLSFTKRDGRELAKIGERTLLFMPKGNLGERSSPLRKYLSKIKKERRESVLWFSKRSPWWRVQAGRQCDAVFSYMNHLGPHLTVVEEGVTCTNTLHRVRFKSRDEEIMRSICVAILSTYTQLHAEGIGRVYGGGVLKFELKDVRRLPVLIPKRTVNKAIFNRIDTALRSGAPDKARALADEFVMPEFFGLDWRNTVDQMEAELTRMRALRRLRSRRRKNSSGP
jgi:adenine-specific DNA-methyltransferase